MLGLCMGTKIVVRRYIIDDRTQESNLFQLNVKTDCPALTFSTNPDFDTNMPPNGVTENTTNPDSHYLPSHLSVKVIAKLFQKIRTNIRSR
jgi:hypothetical protein